MTFFKIPSILLAISVIICIGCDTEEDPNLKYPDTQKVDTVDNYHGTKVADPYRWLEDLDSEETEQWVEAQNAVSMPYLQSLPGRAEVSGRLTELWDYPKYGTPMKRASQYFYEHNDGLQNQPVLYVTSSLDDEGRELINPNEMSDEGTTALTTYKVSPEGKNLAYGISKSGSDWQEFKVRNIRTGRDLGDHLKWIKFSSMTWTSTGNGFYYCRYPKPEEGTAMEGQNKNMKLYYHRVGSSQSSDQLIYETPDYPDWGFDPEMSEDGDYLTISVWKGTDPRNQFYYRPMRGPNQGEIIKLIDTFEATYDYITNDGPVFYFKTNKDAPMNRVIAIDISNPDPANWKTIIPEKEDKLEYVTVANNHLVAEYLVDASSRLRLYDLQGNFSKEIELPGLGSLGAIEGTKESDELFYSFSSFTMPSSIYRYDFEAGASELYKQPDVAFDPDKYVTKQVFYESKDGTTIPMFISHKKDLPVNTDELSFKEELDLRKKGYFPTKLYGYGGFNISITPRFSVNNLVWMELGGIYAVANIRGGGEYGEQWHKAGTEENKQNVFDDFITAAEYLIDNDYTSPERLAIEGGSNGGLLVGACMTQRPDLFAVALPAVGVMDMLRYHKFTIGWAWASDYGTSDDSAAFEYLYDYSPLHNLEEGTEYPAMLITTADHDDRVVPSHSFKFAATLQEKHAGSDPVIIRIETKAGHGAGKPTSKRIEEAMDKIVFTAKHTGMKLDKE